MPNALRSRLTALLADATSSGEHVALLRAMEALLAFAATLVSLRLSADLVRRYRERPAPGACWLGGGARPRSPLGSGALAWGAAAGWSTLRSASTTSSAGCSTAALLGAGSLLRAGVRWVGPLALVYVGLAIGVAIAMPLTAPVSGSSIPEAQAHLALFPAPRARGRGQLARHARGGRRWRCSGYGGARSATA